MNMPRIDDLVCGLCGKQAVMYFVHGARCKEHEFLRDPSSAFEGDGIAGVILQARITNRSNAPAAAEALGER